MYQPDPFLIDPDPLLIDLWQNSGRLVAASSITLLLMLLITLFFIVDRGLRFNLAVRQSRTFIKESVSLFEARKWDAILTIATTRKRSHVARIVTSGLRIYLALHKRMTPCLAIEAAGRSARVTSNRIREDLRKGLAAIGSIATTAPLIGLFGTTIAILDSFRGVDMQRSAVLAMVATNLAQALVTTALGLVVAVLAVWSFNWLTATLDIIDAESRIASLELVNHLQRHTPVHTAAPTSS
jgi:biopolymer transport protein ExbB/TolQ